MPAVFLSRLLWFGVFNTSCVIVRRVNHVNVIMIQARSGVIGMFCWPWPRFFPQLAVFYAECFGRPVSQKGAGRRCDSCVGHGYSDLHTSSWWIIRAAAILWTCCRGLSKPWLSSGDDLITYWSQTVTPLLIPWFPPECWFWFMNLQIMWYWVWISLINIY